MILFITLKHPPGMKQLVLSFFTKLLSRLKQPLLPNISVHRAVHVSRDLSTYDFYMLWSVIKKNRVHQTLNFKNRVHQTLNFKAKNYQTFKVNCLISVLDVLKFNGLIKNTVMKKRKKKIHNTLIIINDQYNYYFLTKNLITCRLHVLL
jgi:hypothetical protein